METKKSGHLYIISNPAFPGWIKIGTTWNLKDRLHTYQTADPFRNYKLEYSLFHPKFREAESRIKNSMKYFALDIKNEWYKIDLNIAKTRLEEQLLDFDSGEWYHHIIS